MSDKSKSSETKVIDAADAKSAAAIATQAAQQSATLMGGISDRTRSLCLGALVVIWGILSQKKGESPFNPTLGERRVLLGIALSVVIVLALDFMEYLAAFQRTQKLGGMRNICFRNLDYDWWEGRFRRTKLILGALTLIVLCVTIGYMLLTPVETVHAQTSPESAYLGTWCGGVVLEGTYSCVEIRGLSIMESGTGGARVKVRYSFQSHPWMTCTVIQVDQVRLTAQCGRGKIRTHRVSKELMQFAIIVAGQSFNTVLSRVH